MESISQQLQEVSKAAMNCCNDAESEGVNGALQGVLKDFYSTAKKINNECSNFSESEARERVFELEQAADSAKAAATSATDQTDQSLKRRLIEVHDSISDLKEKIK